MIEQGVPLTKTLLKNLGGRGPKSLKRCCFEFWPFFSSVVGNKLETVPGVALICFSFSLIAYSRLSLK